MAEIKSERNFELPKKSLNVEFWVGMFALMGMICVAYLSINIAGMKLSGAGYYRVAAVFTDISGLKVGSPVEIAGVSVGEVVGINLEDTEAQVTMEIKNSIKLRDDDIAQVRTKGIIGDKYIRISPGGSDDAILDGGTLTETESSIDFEEVIGKFIHSLEK